MNLFSLHFHTSSHDPFWILHTIFFHWNSVTCDIYFLFVYTIKYETRNFSDKLNDVTQPAVIDKNDTANEEQDVKEHEDHNTDTEEEVEEHDVKLSHAALPWIELYY